MHPKIAYFTPDTETQLTDIKQSNKNINNIHVHTNTMKHAEYESHIQQWPTRLKLHHWAVCITVNTQTSNIVRRQTTGKNIK